MTNQDDLLEFKQEGSELLEAAEKALLSLEDGSSYQQQYNAIFRAFHNLKGAAGMMDMFELQAHTHILETELVGLKESVNLTTFQVDYFLTGIDTAKKLLAGEVLPIAKPMSESVNRVQVEASIDLSPVDESQKNLVNLSPEILPDNRIVFFAENDELDSLAENFKNNNFNVHVIKDYIQGFTVCAEFKPQIIFISPAFKQTSFEELKSIVTSSAQEQIFIDFDFLNFPEPHLLNYINQYLNNQKLNHLVNQATQLLKFQFSDLSEYLLQNKKDHIEKQISNEIKMILSEKLKIQKAS